MLVKSPTRLHDIITHKTTIQMFTAMKTSNLASTNSTEQSPSRKVDIHSADKDSAIYRNQRFIIVFKTAHQWQDTTLRQVSTPYLYKLFV